MLTTDNQVLACCRKRFFFRCWLNGLLPVPSCSLNPALHHLHSLSLTSWQPLHKSMSPTVAKINSAHWPLFRDTSVLSTLSCCSDCEVRVGNSSLKTSIGIESETSKCLKFECHLLLAPFKSKDSGITSDLFIRKSSLSNSPHCCIMKSILAGREEGWGRDATEEGDVEDLRESHSILSGWVMAIHENSLYSLSSKDM